MIFDIIYLQLSSLFVVKPFFNSKYLSLQWSKFLSNYFNCKFYIIDNGNKKYKGNEQIFFLSNHRSEADFFIDYITTYKIQQISKIGVFFLMPINSLLASNDVIFFNRSIGRNKIMKLILSKWHKNKNLNIYPEGHRNLDSKPLKLKEGFIELAYNNNIPVQINITSNKEHIFCLKLFKTNKNISLYTSYSPLINPDDYNTYETFLKKINKEWNKSWNEAYNHKRYNKRLYNKTKFKNINKSNNFDINFTYIIVSFVVFILTILVIKYIFYFIFF